jgi:hypothetical protein
MNWGVRMRIGELTRRKSKVARHGHRAAALIIALVLALCLTMLVIATQLMTTSQLRAERGQRDFDRALELAESGANAYLNYLANGAHSNLTPWDVAPPPTVGSVPSVAQIQLAILTGNKNGNSGVGVGSGTNTIAGIAYSGTMGLVPYPSTYNIVSGATPVNPSRNNQYGYFVVITSLNSATVNMVSYGYANGIVRRVQVGGQSSDIFDWAALWGINPDDAWDISGNLTIVGGFGGNGTMSWGNNSRFYDGPGIAAGVSWPNGTPPTATGTSSPGVPSGHIGSGTLADPFTRTLPRALAFPTADQDANTASGTTQGAEYFRTHNNNFTGIRYLVLRAGVVTELTSTNYTVTGKNNAAAASLSETKNGDDTYTLSSGGNGEFSPTLPNNGSWGNQPGDTFYGIRIYPGTYFFESINMGQNDILNIRSYNNHDRTDISMTGDTTYLGTRPSNDPINPNTGIDDGTSSGRRTVRIYIGHSSKGANGSQDNPSTFTNGCNMEYFRYPSRFRVFISTLTAGNKAITVKGSSSSNAPAVFNVNMLVYNKEAGVNGGNEYGYIGFQSGTYVRGSLIAWHVGGSGGNTVEKVAAEGSSGGSSTGASDRLLYMATSWKDLP